MLDPLPATALREKMMAGLPIKRNQGECLCGQASFNPSPMQSDHFGLANFGAAHLGEYVGETRRLADAAYEAVLMEARTELAHAEFGAPHVTAEINRIDINGGTAFARE